jgi:hypothetical protein
LPNLSNRVRKNTASFCIGKHAIQRINLRVSQSPIHRAFEQDRLAIDPDQSPA